MVITLSGIEEIEMQPGDTVIVAPATGTFSGLGVAVAVGFGARVIAASRNEASLKLLEQAHGASGRLKTVVMKGDVAADSAALKSATPVAKACRPILTGAHRLPLNPHISNLV